MSDDSNSTPNVQSRQESYFKFLDQIIGKARAICANLPQLSYWTPYNLCLWDTDLRYYSQLYAEILSPDDRAVLELASQSCHNEWLRREWMCEPTSQPSPERQHVAGYVYLLSTVFKFYKIGCTTKLSNRLLTFHVQLPFEVDCVCSIPAADMYGIEHQLHERFADKRMRGEWFQLTDEDVESIKAIAK